MYNEIIAIMSVIPDTRVRLTSLVTQQIAIYQLRDE
jgi:hypothetical protein